MTQQTEPDCWQLFIEQLEAKISDGQAASDDATVDLLHQLMDEILDTCADAFKAWCRLQELKVLAEGLGVTRH